MLATESLRQEKHAKLSLENQTHLLLTCPTIRPAFSIQAQIRPPPRRPLLGPNAQRTCDEAPVEIDV